MTHGHLLNNEITSQEFYKFPKEKVFNDLTYVKYYYMYENMTPFLIGFGILLAIIGLYLVMKILVLWNHTSNDVIKAKVFLNKQFLNRNFMFTLVLGFFVVGQFFLQFVDTYGLLSGLDIQQIGVLFSVVSMILLVTLASFWLKLLSSPK